MNMTNNEIIENHEFAVDGLEKKVKKRIKKLREIKFEVAQLRERMDYHKKQIALEKKKNLIFKQGK